MQEKKQHLWYGWSCQYPGWFEFWPDAGTTYLVERAFWHVPHWTQQTVDDHTPFIRIEEALLACLLEFLLRQMLGEVLMSLDLANQLFQFGGAPVVPDGREVTCHISIYADKFMLCIIVCMQACVKCVYVFMR